VRTADDGMAYDLDTLATESIALDGDYRGWRIRFRASLGNTRVAMQVDVGIGDVVYPSPIWIDYPVLLDQPAPHLLAYTPENDIAENYRDGLRDHAVDDLRGHGDLRTTSIHVGAKAGSL
jgi:hypothetical protein